LPVLLVNLGYRKKILDGRGALTLTVSDVFNSLKCARTIDTPILYEKFENKRNSQILYLGFSYRFGDSKERPKEVLEFDDKI